MMWSTKLLGWSVRYAAASSSDDDRRRGGDRGRPRKQRPASISNAVNGAGAVGILIANNLRSTITVHIERPSPSTPPPPSPVEPPSPPPSFTSSSSSSTSSSSSSSSSSSPAPPTKRTHVDWLANRPLLNMIDEAVQRLRSFSKAVKELQASSCAYAGLSESTVRSWYEPRSYELKDAVRRRKEGEKVEVVRTGRPSFLDEHPEVTEYVIEAITNIRKAHGTINSLVIASYFRGYLRAKNPDLLKQYSFSRRWCRKWFGQHFSWTYKKGTTGGQKLPEDWEEQCAKMVKRVSAKAAQHNITHPCFIINWDQTALLLMQGHGYTYHDVKDKHVPMIGQEEKRQITAVVTSTLDGDLLPMQLIFKGQDKNKQQQKAVPTLPEWVARRTREWHLTQTYNHWSSLESMKDLIRNIIKPWVEGKGREHNIHIPHCVLLLDCWSVHKGHEFREWMRRCYPTYHLVFVPAGCTGKAQPADVGLQRPFKTAIRHAFTSYLSDLIQHTVKGGKAPSEVKIDTTLVTLKPLLVDWAWMSWDKLKARRDLIKDTWERCGLSKVLDAAQQREAMKYCMSEPEQALGEEKEEEPVVSDDEDEEEVEEEGKQDVQ